MPHNDPPTTDRPERLDAHPEGSEHFDAGNGTLLSVRPGTDPDQLRRAARELEALTALARIPSSALRAAREARS